MRILSLDGGGSYAGIHARALAAVFGGATPGRAILRQFDLVAGNSGGSIVLTYGPGNADGQVALPVRHALNRSARSF